MHDPIPVLVPLINPNETESLLVELRVIEGQKVCTGDLLASFETTKSTFDLPAERDGFIMGLCFSEGETVKAGETLCYLAETASQQLPPTKKVKTVERVKSIIPQGLRITRPALELAKKLGIELDSLPKEVFVTEDYLLGRSEMNTTQIDTRQVVIYGGGGHAKSLIDLIRAEGIFQITGILDDGIPAGTRILDVKVLGGQEKLDSLRREGIGQAVNAVGGIGSIHPRLMVYQRLEQTGFKCVTVIHPRAFIEPTARVSEGCQLFFDAYIGSDVRVGFGCIVNTGAILSHDCVLCDYVNISPGAILAGSVTVGERALVGMGVTINLGVNIGSGARIGNSAVIKADVPENGIVRAGAVWPSDLPKD